VHCSAAPLGLQFVVSARVASMHSRILTTSAVAVVSAASIAGALTFAAARSSYVRPLETRLVVEEKFATTHCYRHFNNQRDVQACLKHHLAR
jgi:hypothetical protein